MNDETYKEIVLNYLTVIHLDLKRLNGEIKALEYSDNMRSCEKAILRLLSEDDSDADQ